MKSNVVLQSESRKMLGVNVSVMSKDGYVCITEAAKAIDDKRALMGLAPKRISAIMQTSGFRERCYELASKLEETGRVVSFGKNIKDVIDNMSNLNDLRSIKLAYKRGKDKDQKWYINPYLFVMIALEMDPEAYAEVIIWLTDGFIKDRNEAGDAYLKLSSSLARMTKSKGEDFKELIKGVARALNYIVFNQHYEGIRNNATKDQLNEIIRLEYFMSMAMDHQLIKTYDDLVNMMRKEWKDKWGNVIDKALRN